MGIVSIQHTNKMLLANSTISTELWTRQNDADVSEFSLTERIILCVIHVIVTVLGTIGNLIVIASMTTKAQRNKAQNYFIISLSVSDLAVTAICVPINIAAMCYNGPVLGDILCDIQAFVIDTSCCVSLFSITMVAINRYVRIVHPALYPRLYDTKVCKVIVVVTWVTAGLLLTPPLAGWGDYHYEPRNFSCTLDWVYDYSYSIFVSVMAIVWAEVTICACYVRIVQVVRKSHRTITHYDGGKYNQSVLTEDKRLAFQLLFVFLLFNICWAPYLILSLFVEPNYNVDSLTYAICSFLIIMNSACNPLIYFFMNRRLRQAAIKLLTCHRRSPVLEDHGVAMVMPHRHPIFHHTDLDNHLDNVPSHCCGSHGNTNHHDNINHQQELVILSVNGA
ncbi:unnamed protein product, partial [Owenia fusiformis]